MTERLKYPQELIKNIAQEIDMGPDKDRIKERLWNALSKRKPFQNFEFIIDDSKYRQSWFDFKQSQLENYVMEQFPLST